MVKILILLFVVIVFFVVGYVITRDNLSKLKKVIMLFILSLITVGAIMVFMMNFYTELDSAYEPIYSIKKIHSDALNEDIFIKKNNWGVSSNHEVVVISTSGQEKFEPDSTKEYVFKTEFFFKSVKDSLYVYTRVKSKAPISFNSKFKIKQVELDNSEMMELRGYDNFKNKGLELSSYIGRP
jgi:archaellum component FlaF (FlaF/FlaG flagellin family)